MTDVKRWMPLYIADYLTDTAHLGTIEHGAYFLLMTHYWGHGPLPADDTQLRKVARMTAREWTESRGVLRAFFRLEGGLLHHKRIDAEIAGAEAMIETKSEAGREGARKRWQKHDTPNAPANGKAMADPLANAQQTQWQRDAHSHSPPTAEVAVGPPAPLFEDFWKTYPTDKIMSKKAALVQWKGLSEQDRSAALAAVSGFKAFCSKDKTYRPVHACRFLSERRFDGFTADAVGPAKAAELQDRADQLMGRGKYAANFQDTAQ